MWKDAMGQSIREFNFRTVTAQFSKLAFNYPIRVPERFALVIRTLLTQEGICMTLDSNFKLLEVAYPYVAKRLLRDPQYSSRLPQVTKPEESEPRGPARAEHAPPKPQPFSPKFQALNSQNALDPRFCTRTGSCTSDPSEPCSTEPPPIAQPQVLLKDEPMSKKPVFNFRRSFSLIALAAAVAGNGPRGVLELMSTVGDALTLVVRQPRMAMVLVGGMVRWARTKLLVFGIGARDSVKVATRALLRKRPESA